MLGLLRQRGALFFADLTRESKRRPTEVERALGELVGNGLITCDGFAGLRALLVAPGKRGRKDRRQRSPLRLETRYLLRPPQPRTAAINPPIPFPHSGSGGVLAAGSRNRAFHLFQQAGRWSLFRHTDGDLFSELSDEQILEHIAWQLLKRWGVVFH